MPKNPKRAADWSGDDSAALYGIRQWGAHYFDLNPAGEITVRATFPDGGRSAVSLMEVARGVVARGHGLPVLLRIENLLDDRIALLNESFRAAIREADYNGEYRGVFPVKVNQQAQVIEEIVRFGTPYNHGLEAGSKAELVLAIAALQPGRLLVCNGYKDREFIDLGLWARKLGHNCCFVIESPAELGIILERSAALDIRPMIGARIKVSSRVGGLWTETSGDRSSFGLNPTQLLEVVARLRREGMLDCLQLLHCHLGSQIPALDDIRNGVEEACRYYAALAGEGAKMGYIDFGGGLAIDYLGTRCNHVHSRDYSLQAYCATLVACVRNTLDPLGLPHPHLVTESGRATVSHATLLLFNILDTMHFEATELPQHLPVDARPATRRLFALRSELCCERAVEQYREAIACRDAIRAEFRAGALDLAERALGEQLFLAAAQTLSVLLDGNDAVPAGLEGLKESLADIYYGNFSVFQSLPDTWAIGQVFPVAPIHRLNEPPTRAGIISDLTCDCDGQLNRFFVRGKESRALPLHPLRNGEEYIVGVFLMGAYQETMGDLHNLFGDTHVVSIRLNREGGFDVMREINGDRIVDILGYVGYAGPALLGNVRDIAEAAVRSGTISIAERQQILEAYRRGLRDYAYFER